MDVIKFGIDKFNLGCCDLGYPPMLGREPCPAAWQITDAKTWSIVAPLGQLVMDEHQELLKQRTPLLPTGVPNGLDEALRSIRYGRQTRQVQQRIGHEDQTPMFPNGFGTPHAILVEAQLPLTVLIKRFRRPPLQIQADDLGGAPVHPVRHQHHRASRQAARAQNSPRAGPCPSLGCGPPA